MKLNFSQRQLTEALAAFPLWIFPLALSALTFINADGSVSTDMGWYLDSALNLFSGHGYLDIDHSPITHRAPGFPGLIAAAYAVLGVSVYSAFWIIRLFAILNPVVIFFVGHKLFNRWVGLIASLLYVTSYNVNYWSYRHLDAVWPPLGLLAILALVLAFERRSWIYAAISGATLGLTFIIKEIVIVFLPLPLLAWALLHRYRHRRNGVGIAIFGLSFLIVLAPWFAYVHAQTGSLENLLGFGGATVGQTFASGEVEGAGFDLLAGISTYITGLSQYAFSTTNEYSLIANFVLWPLFAVAWLYTLVVALIRRQSEALLLLAAGLFSPLLAYFGVRDFRLGQGVFFFGLTYLASANFLYQLTPLLIAGLQRIQRQIPFAPLLRRAIPITIVTLCLGLQMFAAAPSNTVFLKRSGVVQWLFGQGGGMDLSGRYTAEVNRVGDWITENIPEGSRFAMSFHSTARPIFFYSEGLYPVHLMPVLSTGEPLPTHENRESQIVFMSAVRPDPHPRSRLYALREADLLGMLGERDISYVAVTPQRNFLSLYFANNRGFEQVAAFGGGQYRIFKVDQPTPISSEQYKPLITVAATQYLARLRQEDPPRYEDLIKRFIEGALSWPRTRVDEILAGDYGVLVREWVTYSY